MSSESGLVFALGLAAKRGARKLSWDEIDAWPANKGLLWFHLDYEGEKARQWLHERSGIDPVIAEALAAQETRPRCLVNGDGMLAILRGVNVNPGADPEDMVSVRMWLEAERIVTLRHRKVMAIEELMQAALAGNGPSTTGDFLEDLSSRMVLRMGDVLADLDDEVDALEDEVLTRESYDLRPKIADVRRAAIGLRRYLAPQRDVVARFQSEKVTWLTDIDRARLREVADRTTRYVEDLDSIRDRAAVTQEELNSRLAEQMNKRMYVLAVVAGVFLPLGLLTGLLGINVGGIPGTESPMAFALVCTFIVLVAGIEIWLFRRMKWV